MARKSDVLERKIADTDLRAFAASDQDGARSVLIEIDAKTAKVAMSSRGKSASSHARPIGFLASEDAMSSEQDATRKMSALLDSMGLKHRFLRGARVFVAETSPKQLRKIAKSPAVRSVIPNRTVKQ